MQGQGCGLQGEGVLCAGGSLPLPPPRVAVPGKVDRPRSWPQGRSEGALFNVYIIYACIPTVSVHLTPEGCGDVREVVEVSGAGAAGLLLPRRRSRRRARGGEDFVKIETLQTMINGQWHLSRFME